MGTPNNAIQLSQLSKLSNSTPQALTRRQAAGLYQKLNATQESPIGGLNFQQISPMMPMGMNPGLQWNYSPQSLNMQPASMPYMNMAALQQQQQQLSAGKSPQQPKLVLPVELQGKPLSSLDVEQVSCLVKSIQFINSSMLDTYCATIMSNNITGRVLANCEVSELKNVLNMNFGDWELFKITLLGMRNDELTGNKSVVEPQSSSPEKGLPVDKLEDRLKRMDSQNTSIRRKQTSMERQVALEQATVSGLLSTLNEDAQEDILLEEINNARDEAGHTFSDRASEADEADVLYYAHPSSASTQNIDVMADSGSHDVEKGKKSRRDPEMVWSTISSRHESRQGSLSADLDGAGNLSIPSSSTVGSNLASMEKKSSKKSKKKM